MINHIKSKNVSKALSTILEHMEGEWGLLMTPFITFMLCFLVHFGICEICKTSSTIFTFMWFCSSVNVHMSFKHFNFCKTLSTNFTNKWFQMIFCMDTYNMSIRVIRNLTYHERQAKTNSMV